MLLTSPRISIAHFAVIVPLIYGLIPKKEFTLGFLNLTLIACFVHANKYYAELQKTNLFCSIISGWIRANVGALSMRCSITELPRKER